LGILITKVGNIKTLKLVHKFILLLEFDFLPTYLLHLKNVFVLFLYSKILSCKNENCQIT
jgi:hypothetical protein